ncbi:G:T/U mismatch-specific DNA glycosylase [Moraxella lacunata]|uniref:G:T/U mismatch-specific DNA glycosylase n=1 Tax=Moraxella lacunata TaxID=477 RepID=A0A378TVG4_MORLA|nr:uracil-DNA glycosylase family protein [Moraxella lacunata]STZ63892.1 G:T/U mismatch-specific DNA glycosylase [Moraxella lacunata]
MQESHPLSPFAPPNAKVLMLGSFPPPPNRWAMNFYYPNLNNDMWRIMGLVFFDDKDYFIDGKRFKEEVLKNFLNKQGIAIYDTAKIVIRENNNASDKFLTIIQKSDIEGLLSVLPECNHIITTGEKASEILLSDFDIKIPKVGQSVNLTFNNKIVILHRLPSSSRAYPLALDKKVQFYRAVFDKIGLIRGCK